MSRRIGMLLILWALMGNVWAAIETFSYQDDAERERFKNLTRELRCPKCQNQDLADSNAPIAADLRREIHRLMAAGQSDEQIIEYLVARYGEFVRYRPAVEGRTFILWYGPAGLLLAGAITVLFMVRRRRQVSLTDNTPLSAEERARLAHLLDKKDRS
ncbi:cytochrome c-type biogenesis protein CcmH [Pseudomonas duriflava]|uniref:Cytochrome c-type biogenesis protein n=1 Tax=Pseudomonas duriflava TaxID=459528 RepID=A0A562QAY2_9PSED|nr:cytochrome c-type biogenesis protein [Pseudomonas duriflava]TWI53884.1 cytochrome c-type biogenesis protein CcmH [Pseudomonas duriflava]